MKSGTAEGRGPLSVVELVFSYPSSNNHFFPNQSMESKLHIKCDLSCVTLNISLN